MISEPRGTRQPDGFGLARELTDEDQGIPCVVRHEDAGGQCERPAVEKVYDLAFCEVHGPEARLGALGAASEEAANFFERFRNPHVPRPGSAIQRGLKVALDYLNAERPAVGDYERALLRAYQDVPEAARSRVLAWQAEEEQSNPDPRSLDDTLLEMLDTVHACMRIAFEEGETWLVEQLEEERESLAAQAAVVCT